MKYADTATLLVQDLQQLPFDPNAWDRFAQRLSDKLHGPVVLGTIELASGTPTRIEQVHLAEATMLAYRQHYHGVSPWRAWLMQAAEGTVAAGSAVNPLPPELYENTEFYVDFLLPNKLHHGISARIQRDRTHVTDLAVLRPRDTGTLQPDEQRLMEYMVPHVRRALRVQRLLDAAKLTPPGLQKPAVGVLLVDRDGKILLGNPTAMERISDGNGLTVRRRVLTPTHEAARPRLRQLVRRAVDGAGARLIRGGGDMLLPRANLPPLRVTIAATPPTGDAYGQLAPAALLLLREPLAPPIFRPLPHTQESSSP